MTRPLRINREKCERRTAVFDEEEEEKEEEEEE